MTGHRLLQPIQAKYAEALGVATFCFAICEWNAVNCAERICPGSLSKFVGEELTAGGIAKKLVNLARNMPPSKERGEVMAAAQRFAELVQMRNSVAHGKPCSNIEGEARLSARDVFEVTHLEGFADAFSECSSELNRLLHGFLSTYTPLQPEPRTE